MQVLEIWLARSTTLPAKIFQNKFISIFGGVVIVIRSFPQHF